VLDAINIEDLRHLAYRRLPRVAYDYVAGGAEDEVTVAASRAAFQNQAFRPRVLAGGDIETSCELFGQRYASPIMIGPTGLNGLLWPQGDLCLARAAATAGVGFTLSTASNTSLEEVAEAVPGPKWFQLYPWGKPDFSSRLLQRAETAGYSAVILTVDSLVPGKRERDMRHGFAHQIRFSPRIVLDGLSHPRWLASLWMGTGMPRLENLADFLPPGATASQMADFSRQQRNPYFDWTDLRRIRDAWTGPLILKGVMCVDDALQARALGVDGVVVSNHGGRQLDGAAATLDVLPDIVAAVGETVTVMIDSGFRRGTDIAKALALGAKAVLLGRATLYGLAAGGEVGAAKALSILQDELVRTIRLLGRNKAAALSTDILMLNGR
jgi:(S)-mandelate dehydrogenase